jgi:hypothetical protein
MATPTRTNRLRCEEVVLQLWPLLDGALPERMREPVMEHLADCAGCSSHRDFARAFIGAVRRATPDDAQFDRLRSRVERAISEELPIH